LSFKAEEVSTSTSARAAPNDKAKAPANNKLPRAYFMMSSLSVRLHAFPAPQDRAAAPAQFRSLAEPWADTGTSTGRLMLAVLGGLADVERDLIRTRTAEGRSRAKARGQPMGRPPSLTPAQQKEATRRRARRDVTGIGGQLRPQHIHHAP
jgi:hypothetical protein